MNVAGAFKVKNPLTPEELFKLTAQDDSPNVSRIKYLKNVRAAVQKFSDVLLEHGFHNYIFICNEEQTFRRTALTDEERFALACKIIFDLVHDEENTAALDDLLPVLKETVENLLFTAKRYGE